jgi:hypothetical protein
VAAIRVMLGSMPAMLRGILEEIFAHQSDMLLVGPPDSPLLPVSAAVATHQPDVLVVSIERPDWADGLIELFVAHPRLHILAIGNDARAATMHELYVRRWQVADLSPSAIVDAVRQARDRDGDRVTPVSSPRH